MVPAGRKPLSTSVSHSYPIVSVPNVWVVVALATLVFRQSRSLLYWTGTCMAPEPRLTWKIVPIRLFSGRPPSAGGLQVGSRQVPVHTGGSRGSMGAASLVSLYTTR